MRRPPNISAGGFTLVELLVVTAIIAIVAAIALPRFGDTQSRAHYATVQQDLRHLGAAQELHFQDYKEYALDLEDLTFTPSEGVLVTVQEATASRWSAAGTHMGLSGDQGCAVYMGDADPPLLPNGEPHGAGLGVVDCTF